jgi:hypothetical protein
MVIDGEIIPISDIIGLAPSEMARQEIASQRNPAYTSLDDQRLHQSLAELNAAIDRNENPEQKERYITERDAISAELERRKGPVQNNSILSENEALNEGVSPDGQNNVSEYDRVVEETEEEKEKRLFYENLPKNKKGEMNESSMTDEQKIKHLEYKRGKEFTLNAARKSKQNTEKEIKKLQDRFDRESDPMKLDRVRDQIDFLNQRAKTYENYITASQMEKLRENIDHNHQKQAREAEEARKKEESKSMDAERAEWEALERERAMGIPDVSRDKASDARRRGYRMSEGSRIDRQPKMNNIKGAPASRKFSDTETHGVTRAIVSATTLQPSHKNGIRNNKYFITEAQPKERTDDVSRISSENIAKNINPQEITGGVTAYTGSPIINAHGEVIQGNNRTIALQQLYEQFPEQAAKYKQYLVEHASDYGMSTEEVMSMERPVAVDVMEVSDEKAIRMGQLSASDTESGGTQRIQPVQTSRQLGDSAGRFAEILFENTTGEDLSIGELVHTNANKALDYLLSRGVINNTQYQSAFDKKGNLTPEAKADLVGISTQALFAGANDTLPQHFDMLPAKAKTAILQTIHRDNRSDPDSKIMGDIRMAIEVYGMLSKDVDFVNAKTEEDVRKVVWVWSNQMYMDFSEGNFSPSERFNNFAIELAIRFKSQSLNLQRQMFNALYDNLQSVGGDLFNPTEKLSKTESIRKHYNIEYNGNELQGSYALADNSGDGARGQQRSASEYRSREQSAQGEQPSDSGRGTEPDNGQREQEIRPVGKGPFGNNKNNTDNPNTNKNEAEFNSDEQERQEGNEAGEVSEESNVAGAQGDRLTESGDDIIRFAENETKRNEIAEAERQVNTNPSDAQKESGNYKKGHVKLKVIASNFVESLKKNGHEKYVSNPFLNQKERPKQRWTSQYYG